MSEPVQIFQSEKLKLSVSKFGQLPSESPECLHVQRFTWKTSNRLTFEVITLDAAIVGLRVPDRDFEAEEVILASGSLKEYLHYDGQQLTSAIQSVPLKRRSAWSQRLWSPYVNGSDLIMTNVVVEECRNLMIRVKFSVAHNNVIRINYEVVSDRALQLDTGHRMVLNLGGKMAAHFGTYDHVVQISGDRFYRVKKGHLRDNVEKDVAEDLADLRVAQHVGMAIYKSEQDGFNRVYKLMGSDQDQEFNLRLIQARRGRVMEVYSNFRWLHFSTLDELPNPMGLIAPFYASLGVKHVEQIFDLKGLVNSVVRFIEGDDEEPMESVVSIPRSDTVNESEVRVMIDDLLLKDIEEKIQALKDAKILTPREAREIIEDLLLLSLERMSKSSVDSRSIDEESIRAFIEELVMQNLDRISDEERIRELIEELVLKTVSRTSLSGMSSSTEERLSRSTVVEELVRRSGEGSTESRLEEQSEEPLHEFQKHSGILLQLSGQPLLKKCRRKCVFTMPNHDRQLVYKHSVLLKFGLCRAPSTGDQSNTSI